MTWAVMVTSGDGNNQKYPPDLKLFRLKKDAIKYLRGKAKVDYEQTKDGCSPGTGWSSFKEYLDHGWHYFPDRFETLEGEFWLIKYDGVIE